MQKTTSTTKQENELPLHKRLMDLDFAKSLVKHLIKIGQISNEGLTDEQLDKKIEEEWDKAQNKIAKKQTSDILQGNEIQSKT